jgi:hypothetical protein
MNESGKINGETNLDEILRSLKPQRNDGEFVFCNVPSLASIDVNKVVCVFREREGFTVVLEKQLADAQQLPYSFVAAWITLTVHSSLEAVGLTAAFSAALANRGISCNVVAATFHDHIFVGIRQADEAMEVLTSLSGKK